MNDFLQQRSPYRMSPNQVAAAFTTDASIGLTSEEARARLERYGRNELTAERPVPAWRKLLAQFQSVLVVLLLIATAISATLWILERESALPYEAIAIFAVVLLNAFMGYLQQSRAEHAVAALRQMSAARARVIRDGVRQSIVATEVVYGDLILVEEGDTIPADARLVEATAVQTTEAALTGESLPVSKQVSAVAAEAVLGDRSNMVYAGTAVSHGHGRAVVTATGMQSEMGRIAGMLEQAPDEGTPLQKELDRVGRLLGLVVVAIAIVMVATILLVEDVRGLAALLEVLILGLALAVAAVPEGLPTVVTAVLSLGVQRMAKRNAIVRRLAAVETLGSATVIASDKTGTLTKNQMTVRRLITASGSLGFSGAGYAPQGEVVRDDGGPMDAVLRNEVVWALTAAERANNAQLQERDGHWTVQGDPTEAALIVAARKWGLQPEVLAQRFGRIGELPFSSERKLMSTIHSDAEQDARVLVFTKGAPDVLLERCSHELVGTEPRPLTQARRAAIAGISEDLAGAALRTLAVAFRWLPKDGFNGGEPDEGEVERDLVLLGVIGMIDPPRSEAKDAVARARAAGIRPMMITGDHPRTASVIAAELGIAADGRAITGAQLEHMSEDECERTVREVPVYARVNPEHKLKIVQALQRDGATVAMTGDGVNDAPALKTADIGIAMGIAGTDVSREAADMVLADDNFASIVAAVEEGRAVYANIRKFLRYLLSSNVGEVMTMFFGVLLADMIGLTGGQSGVVLPLVAAQILWINLVTDGAPALALGLDPMDVDVMAKPPRARSEGVITPTMWKGIVSVGAVMAAGTLFVLDLSLPGGLIEGSGSLAYAQTMAFTTLVFFSLITVFNARSDESSAFARPFSNRWLWAAVLLSLALQVAVIYVPLLQEAFSTVALNAADWLRCLAVASSVLWIRELQKLGVRRQAARR